MANQAAGFVGQDIGRWRRGPVITELPAAAEVVVSLSEGVMNSMQVHQLEQRCVASKIASTRQKLRVD